MKFWSTILVFSLFSTLAFAKRMVAEGTSLDAPGDSCLLEIDLDQSRFTISEGYNENVLGSFSLESKANSKISIDRSNNTTTVVIARGVRNVSCRVLDTDFKVSHK